MNAKLQKVYILVQIFPISMHNVHGGRQVLQYKIQARIVW